MRRFLTTPFIILALVMSAAGAAPAAHAADLACPAGCVSGDVDGVEGCVFSDNTTKFCDSPIGTAADLNARAAVAGKNVSNEIAVDPVLPDSSILATVTTFFMGIFAWLLGIAMVTLDNAVYYTVVKMGVYIRDLAAIGVAWRIFRDIGNIALIFGFLSIGITTILGVDWYGDRKKMLPMLIVAAVFLNFSLFISEAVIDAGNLFATQFYTQINGGVPAGQKLSLPNSGYSGVITNAQPAMSSIDKETISNKIMSQLQLQKLYSAALSQDKEVFKSNNMSLINIMGILLFIVAAFVMFSLAFILIARFIYLIFLIITAPIGFAGLAVPQLTGLAKQWWDALFAQTITAPVLLLLLYIALAVITDRSFMGFGATPDFTGYLQDTNGKFNLGGLASMLLSFMIAMGLLLAVTISSKKLGAFGGEWATKTAGKLSFGATAFVARRTVGRASNSAARKIRSSSLGSSETGRMLAGIADRGAKGSFDVRGTSALKNLPGGSIDAGAAQKGGYKGREDELIKARTDYAKTLGQSLQQKDVTKNAETTKDKIKKKHDENMTLLQEAEQAQLKTSKEIINASREQLKLKQQELEAARKSGDGSKISNAELAYNSSARDHDDLKETESAKLDPIRKKIETEKTGFEKAVATQDIIIKDNSTEKNQEKYGKALQSGPKILRAPYDWTTATGSARREAAGKIISDTKKDKSQKQMDRLEAILAKADKEEKPKSDSEDKKPT